MLYYIDYNPEKDKRYVLAYDAEKYGTPRKVSHNTIFLYNNTLIVNGVYNTEAEALKAWGEYTEKPVTMPDGMEEIPARFFGREKIYNVFIPWSCVQGERWPGENNDHFKP